MSSMEEQLWDYIDGNCSPANEKTIALLIEQDDAYRQKYNELLAFNAEFANMELDEPPMAFTYNVMNQIRAEQAQRQPLKAAVDKRIIKGIAAFFITTISIMVIIAFIQAKWTTGGGWQVPSISMPEYKLPQLTSLISAPLVQGFLFIDVVMGLYLFDAWLRRKKVAKTV